MATFSRVLGTVCCADNANWSMDGVRAVGWVACSMSYSSSSQNPISVWYFVCGCWMIWHGMVLCTCWCVYSHVSSFFAYYSIAKSLDRTLVRRMKHPLSMMLHYKHGAHACLSYQRAWHRLVPWRGSAHWVEAQQGLDATSGCGARLWWCVSIVWYEFHTLSFQWMV